MSETTLVVVGTYLNAVDAQLAQSALEGVGIESMVRSDDCGGLRPHLWMGGVELLVRAEDVERALATLAVSDAPAPAP
jgi:Putative prokaryotic signal transducing protein